MSEFDTMVACERCGDEYKVLTVHRCLWRCRQCAVWKDKKSKSVTFNVIEEAVWHLITHHPSRAMWLLLTIGWETYENEVREALRDRVKEGELL